MHASGLHARKNLRRSEDDLADPADLACHVDLFGLEWEY